ncbi:hypothetical protein FRX31_021025 [Thalictrum thalictroides]|uniref:Uncharacterized protein n=1 Tax=Thalictrum thalictroides TaxID=46969 RepID=A0A7J6VXR1_THATH|nr:hypothetical protein FRX31_021025 [Thalictrum thalictroides]
MERTEEIQELDDTYFQRKILLQDELAKVLRNDGISWKQKATTKWRGEGDNCTRFFHLLANAKNKHNALEKIRIGETVVTDRKLISEHVVDYFQNLFEGRMDANRTRPNLDGLFVTPLTSELG